MSSTFFSYALYYTVPWGRKASFHSLYLTLRSHYCSRTGVRCNLGLDYGTSWLWILSSRWRAGGKRSQLAVGRRGWVPAVLLPTCCFHLGHHCPFPLNHCVTCSSGNICPFWILKCATHNIPEKFIRECFVLFGSSHSSKNYLFLKESLFLFTHSKSIFRIKMCCLKDWWHVHNGNQSLSAPFKK